MAMARTGGVSPETPAARRECLPTLARAACHQRARNEKTTMTASRQTPAAGAAELARPTPSTSAASRLFDEARSAEIVISSIASATDPRLREVLTSLVNHLHSFIKDVRLTEQEWADAIQFLTDTGQACTSTRQEFILLSDVLGASMLVDSLNNETGGITTESTVEGPFHLVVSPQRALGDNIANIDDGDPCLVTGTVTDEQGLPIPGARVDVWQADAHGFYDVQQSHLHPEGYLRGLFTADESGRFWFRTIVPRYYPIPGDGPVGRLLQATGRHPNRPAHIHFEVSSPGRRTLTTHLFVADSPYLYSDTVFAVKSSLIHEFPQVDDPVQAREVGLPNPFRTVDFAVTLRAADDTD
jgi:hydroxyquinol 1,2-dioxygenase